MFLVHPPNYFHAWRNFQLFFKFRYYSLRDFICWSCKIIFSWLRYAPLSSTSVPFFHFAVFTPWGQAVEYAHCFPAWRIRRLKGCSDGSASTAWEYTGLLWNLYQDVYPKRWHHSQTFHAQSPLKPLYTWCNMLLTRLHHYTVVSILFIDSGVINEGFRRPSNGSP